MKKFAWIISVILVVFLCMTCLTACGNDGTQNPNSSNPGGNNSPTTPNVETITEVFNEELRLQIPNYMSPGGHLCFYGRNKDGVFGDHDLWEDHMENIIGKGTAESEIQNYVNNRFVQAGDGAVNVIAAEWVTNKNGVEMYHYEMEKEISGIVLYYSFYMFKGDFYGWVVYYSHTGAKETSNQEIVSVLFDSIEILDRSN